mmetsp:Transcript_25628/g.59704  ORF Transcript_25628/g.59704 Transcript_25628/m.59704 type:complete len:391 (-) Transcript_25628:57-1229(-)
MLGLLGRVGGGPKAGAQPAAKRQKRADVLDSLGLSSPSGLKGKSAVSASSASKAAADKEALKQWLAAEEAEPAKGSVSEEVPQSSPPETAAATPSSEKSLGAPPAAASWKLPFADATDRWSVIDAAVGRGVYFDSEQNLYFEWDKQQGLLFQYFPDEMEEASGQQDTGSVPGRHPIWTAECPEMHAEVWEVLPMPPSELQLEAQSEVSNSTVAEVSSSAGSEAASPQAAEAAKSSSAETGTATFSMPPPALPGAKAPASAASEPDMKPPPVPMTRKRPAPPPSFGETTGASSASASSSTSSAMGGASSSKSPLDEDDEDSIPAGPMQGPALPPVQTQPVEEEDDGVADVLQTLGDSDDEPLGQEDCELPAAPADRAEPTAMDMDLDMFAE